MALSFEEFRALCQQRRSVRYFDDANLTMEEILGVLEIAMLAPSVENTQPWRFHVVMNKDIQQKLMDAACYGNFVAGASAFIVVTSDNRSKPSTGETLWNPQELEYSCVAAMEHVLLAATARHYASCWVSLHHGTVHDILSLPKHEIVIGGMMLGKLKKGEESASQEEHDRKPLKNVCQFYE